MMNSKLADENRRELIERAMEARQWAYAPYSNYPVGAALLAESGRIYTGVNVENAAYPNGICAERTAVYKAVSEGEREFQAVAVVTANGGTPCGSCRQVLSEFGLEIVVIVADEKGTITLETDVAGLLPGAFRPDHLLE
jgi:cytidine deaminase